MSYEVSFELEVADLVALSEYHRHTSPIMRLLLRGTLITLILLMGVLEIVGLWLWISSPRGLPPTLGLVIAVILVPGWLIIVALLYRYMFAYLFKRVYAEGKDRGSKGTCSLKLTDEGVHTETVLARSLLKWPAIEKIAETAEYAFLFVNGHSAIILPRRAFTSEIEWRFFVDEARRQATDAQYVDNRAMTLRT